MEKICDVCGCDIDELDSADAEYNVFGAYESDGVWICGGSGNNG
jgi:hypothetical protein